MSITFSYEECTFCSLNGTPMKFVLVYIIHFYLLLSLHIIIMYRISVCILFNHLNLQSLHQIDEICIFFYFSEICEHLIKLMKYVCVFYKVKSAYNLSLLYTCFYQVNKYFSENGLFCFMMKFHGSFGPVLNRNKSLYAEFFYSLPNTSSTKTTP